MNIYWPTSYVALSLFGWKDLGRMEKKWEKCGEKMVFLDVWLERFKEEKLVGQAVFSPNYEENQRESVWTKAPMCCNVLDFLGFFWVFFFLISFFRFLSFSIPFIRFAFIFIFVFFGSSNFFPNLLLFFFFLVMAWK